MAALLSCGAWAENEPILPLPVPTNAAQARVQPLLSLQSCPIKEQTGNFNDKRDRAFQAARLEALYDLCLQAEPTAKTAGKILLDDVHEPLNMLGWLRQTSTVQTSGKPGMVKVKASNSSWNLYEEQLPAGPMVFRADVDGDKIPDEFYYGPDSCISLFSQDRLIGKTANIGAFYGTTVGEGENAINRVSYTEFVKVKSVKRVAPERLSITVITSTTEEQRGIYVGGYQSERELQLDVPAQPNSPSVVVQMPRAERVTGLKNVSVRGDIEAPAGIAKANILLNNKEIWNIPEGLQLQSLSLDLALNLQPGSNEVVCNVWDKNEHNFVKRVRFIAPPAAKVTANRAVLIGVDSAGIQSVNALREQLLQRKYIVKSLRGEDATYDAIAEALDKLSASCQEGDRVIVYFAGQSDWDNVEKVWLPYGGTGKGYGDHRPIRRDDWLRWQKEFMSYASCFIFDDAASPELLNSGQAHVQDMQLLSALQGVKGRGVSAGNPERILGAPTELNSQLVKQIAANPKVDVFDLVPRALRATCAQTTTSLPQMNHSI